MDEAEKYCFLKERVTVMEYQGVIWNEINLQEIMNKTKIDDIIKRNECLKNNLKYQV